MKKCLIVTGGSLNIEWAEEFLRENRFDFVIAADSGLEYADRLKLKINLILGDYDSVDMKVLNKYKENRYSEDIMTYPREKDYTDTELAILRAIDNDCDEITVIGASGSRLDHTMANISVMKNAVDRNIRCRMADENNIIYMMDAAFCNRVEVVKDKDKTEYEEYRDGVITLQFDKYISLLPFGGTVTGVTLEGFKYPLSNYDLIPGVAIGISNEIVGERGIISVRDGTLLIFDTRD